MPIIHYRADQGVYGYRAGDLLVSDRGEISRAVSTGHGVQLERATEADLAGARAQGVAEIRS